MLPVTRGSTPVAKGSSVPRWPTARWCRMRRTRLTTSCEVRPAGLSITRTPFIAVLCYRGRGWHPRSTRAVGIFRRQVGKVWHPAPARNDDSHPRRPAPLQHTVCHLFHGRTEHGCVLVRIMGRIPEPAGSQWLSLRVRSGSKARHRGAEWLSRSQPYGSISPHPDVDVPAWFVAAHHRQYVGALDFRR